MVGILQDETDPMVSVMKARGCVRVCAHLDHASCTHAGDLLSVLDVGECKCLHAKVWCWGQSALLSDTGWHKGLRLQQVPGGCDWLDGEYTFGTTCRQGQDA